MKLHWNKKTVFLLAFVFYLLGNQWLPVTDPVEATYALAAKEMLLGGDWLTPRLLGQPWFDKPVLFYFLTTCSYYFFGVSAFAARLMPALFGALSVTMAYAFVRRAASPRQGLAAALVLGTSLQFLVLSRLIITDMVLFFFTNAALVCFYLGYHGREHTRRWLCAAYACGALAVLTKGPVGLLLPGVIVLAYLLYRRDGAAWRRLHLPGGLALAALVAAPWYWEMTQRFGNDFLSTLFGLHHYLRATVSEHPRDNVFYYYPLLLVLGTLPWSLASLRALWQGAADAWRRRAAPLTVFCLLWSGAYFLFYSLMATKYPTYTFPMLFPVAVLTARFLEETQAQPGRLARLLRPALLLLSVLCGCLLFAYLEGNLRFAAPLLLAGMLYYTWRQVSRRPVAAAALYAGLAFLLLSTTALPQLAASSSGEGLARQLASLGEAPVGLYRHYSLSAVFYGGSHLVKLEDEVAPPDAANVWSAKYPAPTEETAAFFRRTAGGAGLVVVKKKDREAFEEQAASWPSVAVASRDGYLFSAN